MVGGLIAEISIGMLLLLGVSKIYLHDIVPAVITLNLFGSQTCGNLGSRMLDR